MLLSKEGYAKELARFHSVGKLALSPEEIDESFDLPEKWAQIVADSGKGQSVLELWGPLLKRLPKVQSFFENNLRQPAVLNEDSGDVLLLYPYTVEDGDDLNFYRGHLPLEDAVSADEMPLWRLLPDDLQYFYQHVHNGWTFFPANSMGPLPIGDFEMLTEKLDLHESELAAMPVDPAQVLQVFHNGAGDYLCLDLSKSEGDGSEAGILWWHEKPAEPEVVDFWAVMDSWIGIFLEEADRR